MKVVLLTPEGTLFDGAAESIVVPAHDGKLGILDNHAPLLASLQEGQVALKVEGAWSVIGISSGLVEVSKDGVTVLADSLQE